MINVNFEELLGEHRALAGRYKALPDHLAKKHVLASMRRSLKSTGGVSLLRQNTPPIGTRRGRRKKGEKRSSGELRRSVTTKAKWIGRNRDGAAFAALGYKYGWNSRKAIWAEFGTKWQDAYRMVQRTYDQIKGPMAANLSKYLAEALEKAAAEEAGGKNKGYGG